MKRLFTDFITWLKTPDPDTTLLELWNRKKTRDKILKRIEAKQQTEQFRQKVEKEAYFLWEADGKPNQIATAALNRNRIKFNYCDLDKAIMFLKEHYVIGNLEVRIVQFKTK